MNLMLTVLAFVSWRLAFFCFNEIEIPAFVATLAMLASFKRQMISHDLLLPDDFQLPFLVNDHFRTTT
jgi:hypothetical protein